MQFGPSDRLESTQAKYEHDLNNKLVNGLDQEPSVVNYEHWRLVVNNYPYDARWFSSLLLVSKRVCTWEELHDDELLEMTRLCTWFMRVFDKIEINGIGLQSVPSHAHVHLLKGRK